MSSDLRTMAYCSNPVFKKSADHFSQLIYSWLLLPFQGRKGDRRTFIFFLYVIFFLSIIPDNHFHTKNIFRRFAFQLKNKSELFPIDFLSVLLTKCVYSALIEIPK